MCCGVRRRGSGVPWSGNISWTGLWGGELYGEDFKEEETDARATCTTTFQGRKAPLRSARVRVRKKTLYRNQKTHNTGLLNIQSDISIRCVCPRRRPLTLPFNSQITIQKPRAAPT